MFEVSRESFQVGNRRDSIRGNNPSDEDDTETDASYEDTPFRHKPIIGSKYNWNQKFQQLLELEDSTEEQCFKKYRKLSALSADFVHTAKNVGKMIISEFSFKKEERTFDPKNVGGVAGGEKYLYHNIFFKFATAETKDGLIFEKDEYAMKAAAHELKGVMRYAQCENIHVPLLAIIDYRGYRLVAESVLPIKSYTLRYGSSDAGNDVRRDVKELNRYMKAAGKQLNLKGHLAGVVEDKAKFIYGPADIEGHIGSDNRYYVLDFARVFPPTTEPGFKRTWMYKLFRPEFVKTYKIPLSSDGCSKFGAHNSKEHNNELFEATKYLLETVVPTFAKELENMYNTQNHHHHHHHSRHSSRHNSLTNINVNGNLRLSSSTSSVSNHLHHSSSTTSLYSSTSSISSSSGSVNNNNNNNNPNGSETDHHNHPFFEIREITEITHRAGINVRYLGLIRHFVADYLKPTILNEMCSRAIKNRLRAILRETSRKCKRPREDKFRQASISFLNLVLGHDMIHPQRLSAHQYWCTLIKEDIISSFGEKALSDEEKSNDFDLRDRIDMFRLFKRVQILSGVVLTKQAQKDLKKHPESFQIVLPVSKKKKHIPKHQKIMKEINLFHHSLYKKYFKTKKGINKSKMRKYLFIFE